jgi:4-hydroxy-tetrahydrodipicolinate synthase
MSGEYDRRIKGIIPAMATPFSEDGEINENWLRADLEHMIDAGVNGVVVGGSTGEGHTYTLDDHRLALGAAVEHAAGRIPVIAGIIVNSTRQAKKVTDAMADLDLAALQVTPTHYGGRPDDESTVKHFASIAQHSGRPVVVYNVIRHNLCSAELLTHMVGEVDGIIGVKQSAEDLKLVADLVVGIGDRGVVLTATDGLMYPSFAVGAQGAISAILSAVPEMLVELWNAVQNDDHATGRDLHVKLLGIWNAISGAKMVANVKAAMSLQGREGGVPRAPWRATEGEGKERIRKALVDAGVIT